MKKEEAHRFKHQIGVSPYLVSELMGLQLQEIFFAPLDKRLSGEILFEKIQIMMWNLSDEIDRSASEYRSINFLVCVKKSDNLSDYEKKTEVIIDAVQSFFLQHHSTAIEYVDLVADNHILRSVFESHVSKH